MTKKVCVYKLTNRTTGQCKTGITNDLKRRESEHVSGRVKATAPWNWNRDKIHGRVVACFPNTVRGRWAAHVMAKAMESVAGCIPTPGM